jgi:D-alanyl-D-alanine carboxypeptidase
MVAPFFRRLPGEAVVLMLRWWPRILVLALAVGLPTTAAAQSAQTDSYLKSFVRSQNFAGGVLVVRDSKVAFAKSYGFADREARGANTQSTRFHIGSLSMQFTAAAVMALVEQGRLTLATPVAALVAGIPDGSKITIRDLLAETSGLPDINGMPEYPDILKKHQTAASLVEYLKGKTPAFEPGGSSRGEEHSAYNLLALIVEKQTGLSFREAVRMLVFAPLHMDDSDIDDDSLSTAGMARGYAPDGVKGLAPAESIHWSAKTGNGSAVTTVGDERKWIDALFEGRFLSAQSRQIMLDYSAARVGYGWFKNVSKRFGVPIYYMNGRAPGFSAYLLHVPSQKLTVVVLGNVYASSPTTIGLDLAAIAMGRPYEPLKLLADAPKDLRKLEGSYIFASDFYQPKAKLRLLIERDGAMLHWPDNTTSALIPVEPDKFVDRAYWVPVTVHRDARGGIDGITYDRFFGARTP